MWSSGRIHLCYLFKLESCIAHYVRTARVFLSRLLSLQLMNRSAGLPICLWFIMYQEYNAICVLMQPVYTR